MKTVWLDTDIGSDIDDALPLTTLAAARLLGMGVAAHAQTIVDGVTHPVISLFSTRRIASQYPQGMSVQSFTKPLAAVAATFCFFCLLSCASQPSQAKVPSASAAASRTHGGTIAKFDFNGGEAWPLKGTVAFPGQSASVKQAAVGTVDTAGSAQASGGLLLAAGKVSSTGNAGFASGKLPITNREADLKKLTLAFSLSASSTRPVTVLIDSFNAAKRPTGRLTAKIYPAAPNFYQRYALDLSSMRADGQGAFRPADPFVQFSFIGQAASGQAQYRLQVDNVNYASAAYYVSPHGSDANDGRTVATAFAKPQKALDVSRPGDIIDVLSGTYISPNGPSTSPPASGGLSPVANFTHPGTPAAWIVLKNYPGQHPTFFSNGWNIVGIGLGSKEHPYTGPALAYLEIRGLHIRGEGDVVKTKYPDAMDKPDSRSNSNGISIGAPSSVLAHHIRIADNLVEFAPAMGISGGADWMTVENNICRSNAWTNIYASSGISVAGSENFDAQVNVYKQLIRNNICCHNQNYEMWIDLGRYSDGNGIILDVNEGPDPNSGTPDPAHPASKYLGRTLVQSNLCYDNGGSGIHTVQADHVDVINNTVYLNSASMHLEYSEMFSYSSKDVHFINNILVAPVANVAAGEKPEPVNKLDGKNTNVTFSHNVYFGGNIAPTLGAGDMIADPLFIKPSIDDRVANFHLRPDSPAVGRGATVPFSPLLDLDGKRRRQGSPSKGAYEK